MGYCHRGPGPGQQKACRKVLPGHAPAAGTEYIIDNMKKESGLLNAKVIATGGLGRIIYENTDRIDIYDKELTLQGMRLIYEKNKK